jgi:hypothetical protein
MCAGPAPLFVGARSEKVHGNDYAAPIAPCRVRSHERLRATRFIWQATSSLAIIAQSFEHE